MGADRPRQRRHGARRRAGARRQVRRHDRARAVPPARTDALTTTPQAMSEIPAGYSPVLWNPDLAPATPSRRTWTTRNIAALWIGMSINIPTYTLASSLVDQGWTRQAAVGAIVLGNIVVLGAFIHDSRARTPYGSP